MSRKKERRPDVPGEVRYQENHPLGWDRVGHESASFCTRGIVEEAARGQYEGTVSETEKNFAGAHFFLACADYSCILQMRTRFYRSDESEFP